MKLCPVCNSQLPDNQEVSEFVPLGYHEDALALSIKRRIAAEEKLRWIPVSERLPEERVYVLCAGNIGTTEMIVGQHYGGENWYDLSGESWPWSAFDMWMPLPELPKEVE